VTCTAVLIGDCIPTHCVTINIYYKYVQFPCDFAERIKLMTTYYVYVLRQLWPRAVSVFVSIIFYRSSALPSAVHGPLLSVRLSRCGLDLTKENPKIMRFTTIWSCAGSPKALVFGDVKTLRKFEGYHSQQDSYL